MNSSPGTSRSVCYDRLPVLISPDRQTMGKAAAAHVANLMRALLRQKESISMVFAAAPSQNEFLEHLNRAEDVDWSRVVGMHMDEYFSLPPDAPQLFGVYLHEHLFSRHNFRKIHYLDSRATDRAEECRRYAAVLAGNPVDIVCMGIGENGHIAFNDPPVADFQDPYLVKVVELDNRCRQQQVNDGCFRTIDEVPTHALTLTIPALTSATYLSVVVPSVRKAEAVQKALSGEITTAVPASIIRNHPHAILFLDEDAASLLERPPHK